MIQEPPLSETLRRVAHWFDSMLPGTNAFSAEGMAAFAGLLHGSAERAERLEAEATEARSAALDATVRRVLTETMSDAPMPVAPTSEHFTMLIDIAAGRVPGVVLLPVRQARAVPWGQADEGGAA